MVRFENLFKFLGRLFISATFIRYAIVEIVNPSAAIHKIESAGIAYPGLVYAVVVAVLCMGSASLVAGWRARLAAMVLLIYLAPATYFFHFDFGARTQITHALGKLGLAGGLLLVMAAGPGKFSVDKS